MHRTQERNKQLPIGKRYWCNTKISLVHVAPCPVEADETYIGGKVTNMHKAKRKELGIKKCLIHTMKKVV